MKITVYQINHDRDRERVKFSSYADTLKTANAINPAIYDQVFEGDVNCNSLEDVFTMFNMDMPITHRGHSMSTSDILEVKEGQLKGSYFCDSIGFEKIYFEAEKTQKPDNLIKVVVVEPNKPAYTAEIADDYKAIQRVVGGTFQCTYPLSDDTVVYSNDEAKLIGMNGNRTINGELYAGPLFIARDMQDGSTGSLTDEQIAKYISEFSQTEHYTQDDVKDSIYFKIVIPAMPPQRNISFSLVTLCTEDKKTDFLMSGNPTEDDIIHTNIYQDFTEPLDEDDVIEASIHNLCYGDRNDVSPASKEELQYLSENYSELAKGGKFSYVGETDFNLYVQKDMEVER